MSQDEALEKWLNDDFHSLPCGMTKAYMCREAWHAAVKHTLAFVAGEVVKGAHEVPGYDSRCMFRERRELKAAILQMKP
jgi:hypothetical protein